MNKCKKKPQQSKKSNDMERLLKKAELQEQKGKERKEEGEREEGKEGGKEERKERRKEGRK
jgi:hypothetical protein